MNLVNRKKNMLHTVNKLEWALMEYEGNLEDDSRIWEQISKLKNQISRSFPKKELIAKSDLLETLDCARKDNPNITMDELVNDIVAQAPPVNATRQA